MNPNSINQQMGSLNVNDRNEPVRPRRGYVQPPQPRPLYSSTPSLVSQPPATQDQHRNMPTNPSQRSTGFAKNPNSYGNSTDDMSRRSNLEQKPKIDPAQIPSVTDSQRNDKKQFHGIPYLTSTNGIPPMTTTKCQFIDDKNSTPTFVRSTLNTIPSTGKLLNSTGLPFSMIFQPFSHEVN